MPRTKANTAPLAKKNSEFLALVIDSIQDIKGKNIVQLDLRHLPDAPASFFVICEGESSTQIKAIAGNLERRVKEETGELAHSEGQIGARWVLVDFFDVVVHIFDKDTRKYYELEDLWSDAKFTEYKNI
ncbi:MAG: ribosome silencing factor [Saprospiraceae bacterium]|nr:ribosome silencing factor [Saprospiraceae bacterium]MBK8451038.1 ribosome silencing factor [Saprospiraceae bacterium]MBK8485774.1 ribosome silencing factor [Saprospiraceae bacterium]MBK9222399.1 ribosome silencing factor [Saprospiraceae bacterium]MBK9723075.1 ribosome silencing factor [Saprospiraceae bacterium]